METTNEPVPMTVQPPPEAPAASPLVMKFNKAALAQPFAVNIVLSKDAIQPKLDKYWEENKDLIPRELTGFGKKGFREVSRTKVVGKIGFTQFYSPIFRQIVIDTAGSTERGVLAVTDLVVTEEGSSMHLKCIAFYEPTIQWVHADGTKGDDVPQDLKDMVVKLPADADGDEAAIFDAEMERIRSKNVVLIPKLGDKADVVEDGDVAVVTSHSQFADTNEVWKDGTQVNVKWACTPTLMLWGHMYETFKGAKVNEPKNFEGALPESYRANAGRVVKGHIIVHKIFSQQKPEINNDLAISEGFKSLDDMKTAVTNRIKNMLRIQREQLMIGQVLEVLRGKAFMTPIPDVWVATQAEGVWNHFRQRHKSEDEMLRALGLTSRDQFIMESANQNRRQLMNALILRSWGAQVGVEGPRNIDQIFQYEELVKKHIVTQMKVEKVS